MLSVARRDVLRRSPPLCVARWTQRYLSTTPGPSENLELSKPRGRIIFSGIQPTGIPHLGNYLGALSNWVQLQKEATENDKLIFSIVGWHALTLPQKAKELSASRWEMLATILAVGIDPKRSIVFHQDDNQCHQELTWIFNCITPVGKLRRMTTWKARLADSRNANSEAEIDESMLNAGLLTYPVLQAADILAYRATHVPVGEDQTQHLELSREIAQSFNRTFVPGKKRFFPLPTQLITPSKRVLSLRDPSSKMSKSSPDVNSRILLTDTPAQISSKIRSAVTDSVKGISYDPEQRPGISNLLTILGACLNKDPVDVAATYANKTTAEFKNDVVDAVEELFKGPRSEYERLRQERGFLEQVAKDGAERARALSQETMKHVRSMVGLY
ncbi:tryptophanyl-tRNA synthetase [Coprinopsis cinerea okayama7|uniref:Tryptophan--tRNA ligase, mitochondrial n=1 Tax=Coprinopsis cinerea (strain Okayama-7 / 130 / ATCC MYA-4618 / FGSC 9003) TaxID=240176 RepID=A8P9W8_COPC7|nr:tryptophanyl-tRNA synthetase [Coprinopsis cinerea okayama7\|eukprot:XP_001839858.2 tryptophanyl-tRNA synthetase [Coprinopsis cinerea okayama7\